MKKSITKILVIALSFALLIGAAVGFAASANDTAAPEVISKNIKVNGNFCLLFAIDPATIAGDTVTVTVYNTDPTDLEGEALEAATVETITKLASATQTETIDGAEKTVLVIETKGVSAKDIADVWYFTTESNGVVSALDTYSVREYAFERLYKNGTVFATENDEDLKAYYQQQFYLEILDVGSAAQQLLVNYGGTTKERLAKEYTYAAIDGGSFTLNGVTTDRAFVEVGDELVLNGESGWNVYTFGQNGGSISTQTLASGSTVTVAGNTVILPYRNGVTPGKYFDEIGNSVYTMDGLTWKDQVGSNNGTNYFAHSGFASSPNSYSYITSGDDDYGYVLELKKDPAGNTSTRRQGMLHLPIAEADDDNANCTVIEFDFKFDYDVIFSAAGDGEVTTGVVYFVISNDKLENTAGIAYNDWKNTAGDMVAGLQKKVTLSMLSVDYDGQLTDSLVGGDALRLPSSNGAKADVLRDKWYNICIEIYSDAKKMNIYLDGVLASVVNLSTVNISELNTFSFMLDGRCWSGSVLVDNYYAGRISKAYVAP